MSWLGGVYQLSFLGMRTLILTFQLDAAWKELVSRVPEADLPADIAHETCFHLLLGFTFLVLFLLQSPFDGSFPVPLYLTRGNGIGHKVQ